MSPETPYRLALLAIFMPTAAIAGYHRWQAASGEPISHKEEGYLFFTILRLVGACLWFSTLAYLIDPASVHWAAVPLPAWLRWTGAIIGGLGVWLAYWTLTNLGRNLTDTVVVRKEASLVTSGPYRWVRHPFYVMTGILVLAVTLLAANWLIGITGFLVLALLGIRTDKEEAILIDRFGDRYREYMKTTGRFFPRFS